MPWAAMCSKPESMPVGLGADTGLLILFRSISSGTSFMSKKPIIHERIIDLRDTVSGWRKSKNTIALVPTMGALHEGHLSLVRLAKEMADRTIVSIFVNPAQFAPHEDFDSYPRERDEDVKKLAALGVDLVFAPPRDEVYPENFSTSVKVDGISEGLCGVSRPHFFGGVATVVAKLLNQAQADYAIFGEKDYQQLLVIRRMARDLDINTTIIGGPIVREADGLAMSSRNAYLTPKEKKSAPSLYAALTQAASALAKGVQQGSALKQATETLEKAGFKIDYLEVRDSEDLSPIDGPVSRPARVFAAAFLGKTRLIDNVAVPL